MSNCKHMNGWNGTANLVLIKFKTSQSSLLGRGLMNDDFDLVELGVTWVRAL